MNYFDEGFIKQAGMHGIPVKSAKNILQHIRRKMSKTAAAPKIGNSGAPAVTQSVPSQGLQMVPKLPTSGGSNTTTINSSTIRPNLAPTKPRQSGLTVLPPKPQLLAPQQQMLTPPAQPQIGGFKPFSLLR